MVTLKIIDLDVWGNEEDGYEINNFIPIGNIEVDVNDPYDISTEQLIDLLIDNHYIKNSARDLIELSDLGYADYFYQVVGRKTDKPIYNIEVEDN